MLHEGNILIEGTLEDLKQSENELVSKFVHESEEVS
jgi:ABC-type transporter Mla maintaining outer membrane lipid asymmetry ATPase subunit MlaF